MSDLAVAKRYAAALFQVAKEQNVLSQFEAELREVKQVFSTEKALTDFLEHPKVSNASKKDLLTTSFAGISVQILNTLFIMLDRHRVEEITPMAAEFIELANNENSTAEADVYTVRPLSEAELQAVSAAFAAKVGKRTLKLNNIADSSIIGGMKLRIGNRIFDGSVSGKLERLNRQLLS